MSDLDVSLLWRMCFRPTNKECICQTLKGYATLLISAQLCLSVAIQVAMTTSSTVVVVDSSGAFSSLRLEEMVLGKEGSEEVRVKEGRE